MERAPGGRKMLRRAFLFSIPLALPGIAAAQTSPTPLWAGSGPPRTQAEREERHRWMGQNWGALTPEQRRQVEARFRRGMGPHGPNAEEMHRRWESNDARTTAGVDDEPTARP